MPDQPDNLVLEHLRAIRAEQGEIRNEIAESNAKLGAMAQSMVSLRKDVSNLDLRVGKLEDAVQGMRGDVRMIAIAVDEHTNRLDKIEGRLDTLCHTPPLN